MGSKSRRGSADGAGAWAFDQVKERGDVDKVIGDVVSGHSCVAVLGIAIALALTARRASATTLPLAVSQRLWHWDLRHLVSRGSSQTNIMGFTKPADLRHAPCGVRASNNRDCRQLEVRSLVPLLVLSADNGLRRKREQVSRDFHRTCRLISRNSKKTKKEIGELRQTEEIWAEYGREVRIILPSHTGDDDVTYIELINPRATDPDMIAAARRRETMNQRLESFELGARLL